MTKAKPKQNWITLMSGFAVGQNVTVENWKGSWLIIGILEKENGKPMKKPFQVEAKREVWEPQGGDPVVIWVSASEMQPSEEYQPVEDPRQKLGKLLREALSESTALQAVGNRFVTPYVSKIKSLLEQAITEDDRQVLEAQSGASNHSEKEHQRDQRV